MIFLLEDYPKKCNSLPDNFRLLDYDFVLLCRRSHVYKTLKDIFYPSISIFPFDFADFRLNLF